MTIFAVLILISILLSILFGTCCFTLLNNKLQGLPMHVTSIAHAYLYFICSDL